MRLAIWRSVLEGSVEEAVQRLPIHEGGRADCGRYRDGFERNGDGEDVRVFGSWWWVGDSEWRGIVEGGGEKRGVGRVRDSRHLKFVLNLIVRKVFEGVVIGRGLGR
jgi:hypothetical protein